MSPRRIASLRYERRDDDVKLEADITDPEMRDVVCGLVWRLTPAARQWLRDHLESSAPDMAALPDIAAKVWAGIGAPHVIDVAQRKIEEETGA